MRLDLDTEVKDGVPQDHPRLQASARTLQLLHEKDARVIALGHQGRPGKNDFTTLKTHAEILSTHAAFPIQYVPQVFGEQVNAAAAAMKDGDCILVENMRQFPHEMDDLPPSEHAQSDLVKGLQPLADAYINDAFAVSHRSHASIVGFYQLPCLAGPNLASEVDGVERASLHAERPYVFFFGGLKIFDYFPLMEKFLAENRVDSILAAGALGHLVLLAQGVELGGTLVSLQKTDSLAKEKLLDLLPKVKTLMEKYPGKLVGPLDVAIETEGARKEIPVSSLPVAEEIFDVGAQTAANYEQILGAAKTVFVKGPAGFYEKTGFNWGSRELFNFIANSPAFTLVGGGSSSDLAFDLDLQDKFSHVSLAGGATLLLLAGEKLPGLQVLEESAQRTL